MSAVLLKGRTQGKDSVYRVAVAEGDPVVAITSIMSHSHEIFAPRGDGMQGLQDMQGGDGEAGEFEDGAETLGEVQNPEPAATSADLASLQGQKVLRPSNLIPTLYSLGLRSILQTQYCILLCCANLLESPFGV